MSWTTLVFNTFYVEIILGLKFWFEPVPHTYIQRTFVIVVLPTFSQVCSGLRSAACVFLRFETMNTASNLLDVLFSNRQGNIWWPAWATGQKPTESNHPPVAVVKNYVYIIILYQGVQLNLCRTSTAINTFG